MTTPLQLWAKKLRAAADVIDGLFEVTPTPAIARRVLASAKGRSYNGKHWTQRPENRLKMRKAVKKMQGGRHA